MLPHLLGLFAVRAIINVRWGYNIIPPYVKQTQIGGTMKRFISEDEKMRMVRMVKNGTPIQDVCQQEGVSRSALYDWIKLYGVRTRWGFRKTINLRQVYQMERRLASLEKEVQIFRKSGCGT